MSINVLIVEDEPAIQELIAYTCRTSGFEVARAGNVSDAKLILDAKLPDLVLLDWMLPDCSGLEWLRQLRKADATKTLPVIMLTAKGQEDDKVAGLEAGADDYVVKPFSPRELVARIRTAVRRNGGDFDKDSRIVCGNISIDSERFEARAGEDVLKLSVVEFKILSLFASHSRPRLFPSAGNRQGLGLRRLYR